MTLQYTNARRIVRNSLLLDLVAVAAHELLNAARRVDNLLLTRVERVAERTDFHWHYEIFDAVDGSRIVCLQRRDTGPFVVAVDEKDGVSLWMGIGFHGRSCALRERGL